MRTLIHGETKLVHDKKTKNFFIIVKNNPVAITRDEAQKYFLRHEVALIELDCNRLPKCLFGTKKAQAMHDTYERVYMQERRSPCAAFNAAVKAAKIKL